MIRIPFFLRTRRIQWKVKAFFFVFFFVAHPCPGKMCPRHLEGFSDNSDIGNDPENSDHDEVF